MKFNCAYTELVDLHKIIENPENLNNHPNEQIEYLSKIIDYQGQRSPIVVSKRSGFITKGHGRFLAIKNLGWQKAAVDFQDYENAAQEYADIIADNEIAKMAFQKKEDILDLVFANDELKELDPVFLGLPDLNLDDIDDIAEISEDDIKESCNLRVKCQNMKELATLQNHFGISGQEITFERFMKEVSNENLSD